MNEQMMVGPMDGEEEGEMDPALQQRYEEAYHAMNLILDEPETFQQTRKMFSEAQAGEMLIPQASQAILTVIGRLEKDMGPLEDDVLLTIMEDLTTGMSDRYGVEMTDEEETNLLAAVIGLWSRQNPERAMEGMTEEDNAQLQQMVAQEEQESAGQQQPPGAPQRGLMGGGMA